MSEVQKIHERIWLQYEEPDVDAMSCPGDITWCQDRINESDVEYVLAEVCAAEAEEHAKERLQLGRDLAERDAETARLREQRDAMDNYTIGLQRLIEALAHGHELREEGVAGTHLLDLAKKVRAEIARLQNKALAYAGISRRDADVVELVARRDDNKRLREALENIIKHQTIAAGDMASASSVVAIARASPDAVRMSGVVAIARAALGDTDG